MGYNNAAEEAVDKLLEALAKYGQHRSYCPLTYDDDATCTCGLNEDSGVARTGRCRVTPLVAALASFVAAERKVHEGHANRFPPLYIEGAERDLVRAGEAVERELRQMMREEVRKRPTELREQAFRT